MPEAIVIAGANGAGKTTFARELIPTLYPYVEFLNVDEVQAEAAAFTHPVAAGRCLLKTSRCDAWLCASLPAGTRCPSQT
jgi:predicted ABC-type ATPase